MENLYKNIHKDPFNFQFFRNKKGKEQWNLMTMSSCPILNFSRCKPANMIDVLFYYPNLENYYVSLCSKYNVIEYFLLRSPILKYWQSKINIMVASYDKFSMAWWFMINQFHNSSRRVLWCAFLRSKEIIPTLWVYVCGLNKVYVVLDAHITHSHIGYHLHSTHFRTKKSIFQKREHRHQYFSK